MSNEEWAYEELQRLIGGERPDEDYEIFPKGDLQQASASVEAPTFWTGDKNDGANV